MTINEIISRFNTTPFLFVGSGMTRRYLGLPNWRGLLEHFAQIVREDEFAYNYYESKAKSLIESEAELMPKLAELLRLDFNEKWFCDPGIRTVSPEFKEAIKAGLSPFKAEIASYIQRISSPIPEMQSEIDKLIEISEKSIAGVITTNYDTFLEDHFIGFKTYVGQNQLIFSPLQGIAEIYKIHGSVELPESIVIDETDYAQFDAKSAYLAAKLMTIFMEYPIIFIGYSISDSNILGIIKSIVNCLDNAQIKKLEDRFIFVEYKANATGATVESFALMVDGKPLTMRKITLSDFIPLYEAIGSKKATMPVRLLRRFKQDVYSYVITNTPTSTLRVAALDDPRVDDDDFVLSIGRADQAVQGLRGLTCNQWYRNIILDDLNWTADDLLEYAFPILIKQNSNTLPVHKYLASATKSFPDCEALAKKQTLDDIIPETLLKKRGCGPHSSIKEIWDNESSKLERAVRLISQLPESQMDVFELEAVLKRVFENEDILESISSADRTQIRRLIRIYDYLKWAKK